MGAKVNFYRAAALAIVALLSGCATSMHVSESYIEPAEINLIGRKNVVLKGDGQDRTAVDAIHSRLRESLVAGGFTVIDHSAMDLAQAENFLTGQETELTGAHVSISAKILRNDFSSTVESSEYQTDKGTVYRYRAVGKAQVEVAYNVTDLKTTTLLYSDTIVSGKDAKTDWGSDRYPQISSGAILSRCYQDNASNLVDGKIAPKTKFISHTLYPLKEYPESIIGISCMNSGDYNEAFGAFQTALATARQDRKTSPKTLGQLNYNLGVAKEMAGDYQGAIPFYSAAACTQGALRTIDYSEALVRCRQRLANIDRLREQGLLAE
jgi:hypothetical protein